MSALQISLSADGLTTEALRDEVRHFSATASDDLELAVQPAARVTRAIDPTVLVALVTGGSTAVNALIVGLFGLMQRRDATKLVIQGANGARVEAPASLDREELDRLVAHARDLDPVHIHIAGA